MVLVLLGANQAHLAQALDLDLTRTGMLASALAGGIGVGVVVAGPWIDRAPRRPIYWVSMALSAAALFGFHAEMSFAWALACTALLGFGIGLYDTLVSVLVVERYHDRAPRPMAVVHSAATLGALACPFLVAVATAHASWTASFHATGLAHLALAGAALFVRFPDPPRHPETAGAPAAWRGLLPFAAVGFAYVGIEASLTIFAVPYASSGLGLASERGLGAISAFWLGLFLGRIGLLAMPGPTDGRLLVGAGLLGGALIGGGAALGVRAVELHFAVMGVALGFVFPLMVALAGQHFPRSRATVVGLVIGASELGGVAVPWLHGALGDGAGVRAGVGALALWSVAFAVAAHFTRSKR